MPISLLWTNFNLNSFLLLSLEEEQVTATTGFGCDKKSYWQTNSTKERKKRASLQFIAMTTVWTEKGQSLLLKINSFYVNESRFCSFYERSGLKLGQKQIEVVEAMSGGLALCLSQLEGEEKKQTKQQRSAPFSSEVWKMFLLHTKKSNVMAAVRRIVPMAFCCCPKRKLTRDFDHIHVVSSTNQTPQCQFFFNWHWRNLIGPLQIGTILLNVTFLQTPISNAYKLQLLCI